MSQRGRGRGRHYDQSSGSDAPSFHRGGDGRRRDGGAPPSFPSESGPSQLGRGRAGGSGAVIAWWFCLFRPDRVKALVNMSVAFSPRNPKRKPVDGIRALPWMNSTMNSGTSSAS
ncbi:hypothetical protein PRUPE_2G063500 [Prunus persica]|uniref:Uncharacterized protein n=1 Tax=Prunus persica TaxID=3760 RepID=M5XL98_PRUPE|nr:hypothetical protein PRUPE_2G063500 [Prunus persica]